MKLQTVEKFLSRGTSETTRGFVAAGIHPSSEVDIVDIGGQRLGVGSLVPLVGDAAQELRAVRRRCNELAYGSMDVFEGQLPIGERLVLQLYEKCDPLIPPPSSRLPVWRKMAFSANFLGPLAADMECFFRLPFQGRKMATISFERSDNVDFSVYVVGARRGFVDQSDTTHYTESTVVTWFDGGAAPTHNFDGNRIARVVHVGGFGDAAERFDELQVCAYGNATAGIITITGEAYGEGQ